ncbi:hypothetical protein JCGZ_24873 [Jatropha curcas]|uniref:Uncharacterized protein n=1 Tax=Jatropha curcas TaxID=180498 RepID=A0A067L9T5_JATCU|nr:uncharacterized protein LOC105631555 [Jatropha curcas]KDP40874.1 hypothetical protein JCGZ_24873 [Jatropha curcas]
MEQNLIPHHSSGRNSRIKGLDKKNVLQVVSLLAVCMWLLYQIKNSNHKPESYNGITQSSSGRNISIILGRKGILEYINGVAVEFQDKNASEEAYERRKDGGVGDDELDMNIDEDIENALQIDGQANQDTQMKIVEDNGENVNRIETFLDENGIPPDAASYFVNSTPDTAELNESGNFIRRKIL